MNNNDLNLLRVFALLLDERNVSRAAARLHLTQSALSRALTRLRRDFGDPLFVRAPGGVLPTAKALSLEASIRDTLERVNRLYETPRAFDPKTAKGVIRIATTDYFEQVVWTELAGALHKQAPGITMISMMTGSQIPVQSMRDGEVQLAVAGFFGEMPAGFMKQSIFSDSFVCTMRASGTRKEKEKEMKDKEMTLERFLSLSHLIVSPRGELDGAVDAALQKKGKQRHIAASVCSFLSSGPLVANSDLVLTAPARLVAKFSGHLPLVTFAPPLLLPKINIVQVWHERYHRDPMLQWFRHAIAGAIAKLGD